MIVVSDTSPLHYFIAVKHAHLLQKLFTEVFVPPAVVRELSHASTPMVIQEGTMDRPAWLTVHSLVRPLAPELTASLHRGEAEAIQLAEEQNAGLLILDEWKGRMIAQSRGVPLTGALGILGLAYQKHMPEDPVGVLSAMRAKGFRIHDELFVRFQILLQTRYPR
jgi:hypothetical protein